MRFSFMLGCCLCLAAGAVVAGCARLTSAIPDSGSGPGVDASPDRAGPTADVARYETSQDTPAGGCATSISGTVFAPNGSLPLYNVTVFVPTAPLEPFPAGVTCDHCGTILSGKALVVALSDAQGHFILRNVPAGANVPLVFQVGRWRRQVTIAQVVACQDNPIGNPDLSRLPRNRREGDMPRIAVVAGKCDQLGCLLPKLGVDLAELGVSGQDRAVTIYNGMVPPKPPDPGDDTPPFDPISIGPANMRPATELWNDEAQLSRYDLTVLSCECEENLPSKNAAAFANMTGYLAKGGRVFGSHYSYVWLQKSPDPEILRSISIRSLEAVAAEPTLELSIDTSFPKGKAMADWMMAVDPAVTYGQIYCDSVFENVRSVTRPSAQAWASAPATPFPTPAGPRIVTVNTPAGLPAEKQCGRASYLGAHITKGITLDGKFPANCGDTLTKGEQALAFLFFDLSACIQDDSQPVMPPIP